MISERTIWTNTNKNPYVRSGYYISDLRIGTTKRFRDFGLGQLFLSLVYVVQK